MLLNMLNLIIIENLQLHGKDFNLRGASSFAQTLHSALTTKH